MINNEKGFKSGMYKYLRLTAKNSEKGLQVEAYLKPNCLGVEGFAEPKSSYESLTVFALTLPAGMVIMNYAAGDPLF